MHREIDLESSRLGKPIYSVVDDAWEAYKKAAYQLTPEAAEKDSELIARFLRLWYKPEGIEVHIRDLLKVQYESRTARELIGQ